MSYPNLGGNNSAQMSYGGDQPGGYGGQHPGAFPGPGGHPGQPSGYGGAHGGQQPGNFPQNPNAGYPGGVSPEVQQWFNAVDRDRSGKITAQELKAALVNGQGKNFSDQACNLMIGMFDHDKTGTIDINEFQQLYNYINQWLGTFRSYDRDQSGHIEEAELSQAFQQMGFRFSPEFIKFLIAKSDMQSHSKISVDQFIVLCVQIQRFTDIGSEVNHHTFEQPFEKFKRKRKHKGEDITQAHVHFENGVMDRDKMLCDEQVESRNSLLCELSSQPEKLQQENEKFKKDMNQLINENVHLLKENKQLQEDNCSLEDKVRCLQEENELLRKEHSDALELSSWLNSAKEIVETLKRNPFLFPKPVKKLSPTIRPLDVQSRLQRPSNSRNTPDSHNSQWSNGDFCGTPHVKIEETDEDQFLEAGQESPYHTPLLNFDQVEFFPTGKEGCDVPNICLPDMVPNDPMDEINQIGRKQLLFPDPIDGVCELCPGSRIYVALTAMDNILSKKSHSSVARSCLEAIFKMPFLLSCSVQGNVAKGPYGKPEVQRPSLYRPAVECILKYARYHAEQNGWKVEENTTIKKQMNTRLSELRNITKYKAAYAELGEQDHKGSPKFRNIVAALSAVPLVAQTSSAVMIESETRNNLKDLNLKIEDV